MASDHERAYQQAYRLANRDRRIAEKRAYRKREDVRLANNLRNRTHPHKKAWDAVRNRIMKGTLKRAACVFCGEPNAHAHHEDYSRYLDIVWVCHVHHCAIHSGELKVEPRHIVTVGKLRQFKRDAKIVKEAIWTT